MIIKLKVVGAIEGSLGVTFNPNLMDPPSTGLGVAIGFTVENRSKGPAIIMIMPSMKDAPNINFMINDCFSPLGCARYALFMHFARKKFAYNCSNLNH